MSLDRERTTQYLRAADFRKLFIEELGWDNPVSRQGEIINAEGQNYTLLPVAEKRGVRIFRCETIPDRPVRQRIEREITKLAFEHLIIYLDAENSKQIWQWVAREKGKPDAFREHSWLTANAPNPLIQKLDHIAFSLDEEEALTLAGTTLRMKDAFDREKITKKFYDAFKKQHDEFFNFITGLTNTTDKQWYASLMLNRLMFVYFIQKKGFLDDDIHYLKNRLIKIRETQGDGKFHGFYRAFLLKLFHGGLATPANQRDADTNRLIGTIPYLNGGLFEPHVLETDGSQIQIDDQAFEAIFNFFDQYEWTLDTRAIERADGKEINPDVLGHIFEKYINQKQMGAYYTKEDITDYITKNTVIPWLFQNAETLDKVAFEPGGYVWQLLSENPDTYIYESVAHGADKELPENIEVGIDDVSKRGDWNKATTPDLGLPTEIWRETVARRQRYKEVKHKIVAGEISAIEDLITYNLDIRQFAQDIIQYAESPDVVRAFWKGISAIKVLDPACGSGAFLFAALGILFDLYDACLERMEQFVSTAPQEGSGRAQLYSDFRKILEQVATHPNRQYFIYKSIIISNLYGVDIMDEAVEICKLRLFLKLAAQLESVNQIEPLPDIDFNIRAGNSILGFKSIDDALEKTNRAGLQFNNALQDIQDRSGDLDHALVLFREQQTKLGGSIASSDKLAIKEKLDIKEKLASLKEQLDTCFFDLYASRLPDGAEEKEWAKEWVISQKPFHWVIEFHDIISKGGFSAIIGNPPYVEIDKCNSRKALTDEYGTCLPRWSRDEDLYTLFIERSLSLSCPKSGSVGMIVPLSVTFSTKKPFVALRKILSNSIGNWHWSHFDRIPSSLFGNDVRTRCSIGIFHKSVNLDRNFLATTSLQRWTFDQRDHLFGTIEYASFSGNIEERIPKVANDEQAKVLQYLQSLNRPLALDLRRPVSATTLVKMAPDFPENSVFVAGTAYNWFPAWRSIPATTDEQGNPSVPARAIGFSFGQESDADLVFALLCSSLGYWWWAIAADGFNLKKWLVESFPLSVGALSESHRSSLSNLGGKLRIKLKENYVFKDNKGRKGNFNLPACEEITREIDAEIVRAFPDISLSSMNNIQQFNSGFSRTETGNK